MDISTTTDLTNQIESLMDSDLAQLEQEIERLSDPDPKHMKWITKEELTSGKYLVFGFLRNKDSTLYVNCNDRMGDYWLYANEPDFQKATYFQIYHSKGNDLMYIRHKPFSYTHRYMYFNWRNSSGACKLHDNYDRIEFKWDSKDKTVFQIYSPDHERYVGYHDKHNNELYLRDKSVFRDFKIKGLAIRRG